MKKSYEGSLIDNEAMVKEFWQIKRSQHWKSNKTIAREIAYKYRITPQTALSYYYERNRDYRESL